MVSRFTQEDLRKEFDVIVIGGGINGCGITLDATLRGLKVLLLEKEDFAYGCTSASTRLIHGGLRYLENFEFDLVRESLIEREILLKLANHLVKPIELCIPIYRGDKKGYFLIKAGMVLYDLLSYGKSLPSHRMFSANKFLEYEPSVKGENLLGGAVYYDSQVTFPERICIENILLAKDAGALVLNHSEVISLKLDKELIISVEFKDALCGRTFLVKGKIVINASGPWVDSLCGLSAKHIKSKIGGTKGTHIIIKQFEGGPKHALYMVAKSDGRPFFIIPWREFYLLGTTDIPYFGDLDTVNASFDEIKYLLDEANNRLKKKIIFEDILFTYSGVRPLPLSTSLDPSKITRKHIVYDHQTEGIKNFLSIIGGKLTTYRNLSEEAIDLVFKKLNYKFLPSQTKERPFIGFIKGNVESFIASQIKKVKNKYDLDQDILINLINLYGSKYKRILDLTLKDPECGKLLSSHSLDIRAQVVYAIQNELAFTVSDVLLRRTTLGLSEDLGRAAFSDVAKQLQAVFNYSNDEIKKQIIDYEEKVIKLRTPKKS